MDSSVEESIQNEEEKKMEISEDSEEEKTTIIHEEEEELTKKKQIQTPLNDKLSRNVKNHGITKSEPTNVLEPVITNKEPAVRARFHKRLRKTSPLQTMVSDRVTQEKKELLKTILKNPSQREDFISHCPDESSDVIDLWERINRFIELSPSVDSVVLNNMAIQICKEFCKNQSIPKNIRKQLDTEVLQDMQDRTFVMQDIREELVEQILEHYLPLYPLNRQIRKKKKRKLTKSIQRDPFEDNDDKLSRYIIHPTDGTKQLIACTAEKIIQLITSDCSGKYFFTKIISRYFMMNLLIRFNYFRFSIFEFSYCYL